MNVLFLQQCPFCAQFIDFLFLLYEAKSFFKRCVRVLVLMYSYCTENIIHYNILYNTKEHFHPGDFNVINM